MNQKIESLEQIRAHLQALEENGFSGTVRFIVEAGKIVWVFTKPDAPQSDGDLIPANIGGSDGA